MSSNSFGTHFRFDCRSIGGKYVSIVIKADSSTIDLGLHDENELKIVRAELQETIDYLNGFICEEEKC